MSQATRLTTLSALTARFRLLSAIVAIQALLCVASISAGAQNITISIKEGQGPFCGGSEVTLEVRTEPFEPRAFLRLELIDIVSAPDAVVQTLEESSFVLTDSIFRYTWAIPASYREINADYTGNGDFAVRVTNVNEEVEASTQEFRVIESIPLRLDSQLVGKVFCDNDPGPLNLRVAVRPDPRLNVTYEWYRNDMPLPNDLGDSLFRQRISVLDTGTYYVRISSPGTECLVPPFIESERVRVDLVRAPLIQEIVPSEGILEACEGDPAEFSIVVSGDYQSIQWLKDGSELTEAENRTSLSLPAVSRNDVGSYRAQVLSACGVISQDFELLVVDRPEIKLTPPPGRYEVDRDSGTILRVEATNGGENLAYQWFRDDMLLDDGIGPIYEIPAMSAADEGRYVVQVLRAGCRPVQSEEIILAVRKGQSIDAIELSLPTVVNARIGEDFVLPLSLSDLAQAGLQNIQTLSYDIELRLNATIARPLFAAAQDQIDAGERTIRIDGSTSAGGEATVVLELPFKTLFGNAAGSDLTVEVLELQANGVTDIPLLARVARTKIVITNIWYDAKGEARLLNPVGTALGLVVAPNPVGHRNRLTMDVINGDGDPNARLMLYDVLGNLVADLTKYLDSASGRALIDLDSFPSLQPNTSYYCRYGAGARLTVRRVLITRP